MRNYTPTAHNLVQLGRFGDRTRPIQAQLDQAALVIGLGHIGMQAVILLHQMLGNLLTRREQQTNVRLLAISRRRALREEGVLPRESRLALDMETLPWSDVPGRYSAMGVPQWWPHSPGTRTILEDPMRVRAFNRLLLYDNAALVGETFYKLIQWLQEVGTGRDLDIDRRIYVLTSLAESEGGGMLFDVVSRLRALCGQRPTTIVGVFALNAHPTEDDPDQTLAMANVYASLREIDSYVRQPELHKSTLPAIGYSLPLVAPQSALDAIYLTGDETAELPSGPPAAPLAELTATWIAAGLQTETQQRGPLPEPIPHPSGIDRFQGYSTFGVSKIALPTRVAMDLAAVGLAQAALRATKTAQGHINTSGWVNTMIGHVRDGMSINLTRAQDVAERLREWAYSLSAAGLTRLQESRAQRGEDISMLALVRSEWRRLEREMQPQTFADQGTVNTIPDSLRVRMDDALATSIAEVRATLLNSPVDLAYAQGYGLVWARSALEGLGQQFAALIPRLESAESEANAAYQLARDAFFAAAEQYDTRTSGRVRGGGRRTPTEELAQQGEQALTAAAEWTAAQARLALWIDLRDLTEDLAAQMREILPVIDSTAKSLHEFETACRQAMEEAAMEPPQFPAAVLLTEEWYIQGIQSISSMGQVAPQDLLQQVYEAWGRGGETSNERRLVRFATDILDAARRVLAGMFGFMDLHEFISTYGQEPAFQQILSQLPGASTPSMVPTVDDNHRPPVRYEIVREVPRSFSALSAPQHGVIRTIVPSPDPDEITVLRVLHGMMAEAIPALRDSYRRAYDRAGAEGMPLHVDRRWDATMADLVHTTARREISLIWERLIEVLRDRPGHVGEPLEALIHAFGVALDVEETIQHPGATPTDMRMVVFKLRPFRLKLPPPHCAVLFLYTNRSGDEIGPEIMSAITPLPLEEQFAFVVNITSRPDLDTVLEPLRHVDFTMVELREADVKHLLGARLPTRALSDFVLDQVNLTTVSPFYTRGPVPEHMFFGREREINEVRSKLRTHSVALIGGRRIGKTSTLQRIQRILEPEEGEYVPYYLDCHGATNYTSFFWLIRRRWNVNIPEDASPVQFELVIEELRARHPGKNIVILFDEVDSLMLFDRRAENQETLFRTFRSLSNEKRCQYVFSGEKWLMRSASDPYSALFNFAQSVRLEPLPPRIVHRLVAEPFEMLNIWIEQSEQVINRVYQISAGHPNIVQMICQAMVEELDQDSQNASLLNVEHLDRATSRRQLQEQIVQTIWGQMDPLARMITLIWPEGQRFLTLTQIEAMLAKVGIRDVPPERLEWTAKALELYCFVRPREQDQLELIPMAFPAILDFMTDKTRQIEIVRGHYEKEVQAAT